MLVKDDWLLNHEWYKPIPMQVNNGPAVSSSHLLIRSFGLVHCATKHLKSAHHPFATVAVVLSTLYWKGPWTILTKDDYICVTFSYNYEAYDILQIVYVHISGGQHISIMT